MIAKTIWAVEPEEYVTVCNNPEPDKTLVVALIPYEALFHPSNLCGFTQNFCFTYSHQTRKELLSNIKHSKPLGDQIRDLIWTLIKGHPEKSSGNCLHSTPLNKNPAKMMEKEWRKILRISFV